MHSFHAETYVRSSVMIFIPQYERGGSFLQFPTGHARGSSLWTFLPLICLGSLKVILRTNGLPALLLAGLQISLVLSKAIKMVSTCVCLS